MRDVDVYIEQPCLTYEECLSVRRHTDHPFVLDENIDGLDVLLRAHADLAMDVVNLKISKLGGLTRTAQARDLCVSLGIAMTLEDSWGGDIVTAAIAHLAHSTPTGAAVHGDRLQQLRHGHDRRGRAAARQRPHGGVHRPGARHRAAVRHPGSTAGDRRVTGSRKPEAGSRKLATGNWNWQLATGNWQLATPECLLQRAPAIEHECSCPQIRLGQCREEPFEAVHLTDPHRYDRLVGIDADPRQRL